MVVCSSYGGVFPGGQSVGCCVVFPSVEVSVAVTVVLCAVFTVTCAPLSATHGLNGEVS